MPKLPHLSKLVNTTMPENITTHRAEIITGIMKGETIIINTKIITSTIITKASPTSIRTSNSPDTKTTDMNPIISIIRRNIRTKEWREIT